MSKKCFIIFSILICILHEIHSENKTLSTRTWTNLSYSSASATDVLDIYLPATGDGPFPVVIWIHGGAFKMGSKANPQSLTALNNAGFAVVSINYRLSTEAIWPAQLNDLKACVKFLKTNAATYALNPNKIASWGASAGAHLSCMMGAALASDPATRIQATVSWFAPIHFYYQDADMALSGVTRCTGANGDASSPESALIGAQVSLNKALCDAASPVSFVDTLNSSTPLPNFLLMHGGLDCNIGANQSVRMHNAIQNRFGAAKSQYIFLPNGTHGAGDFSLSSTETTVINFLKAQLISTDTPAIKAENNLKISYNSTLKILTIEDESLNPGSTRFSIYDLSGMEVKTGDLKSKTIEMGDMKGVYLLRLQDVTFSITKKIILN